MTKATTIYADYAASAPLRPEAAKAMSVADSLVGNPNSIHSYGRKAQAMLDSARQTIASLINADTQEVVFTSGGSEADALAVLGLMRNLGSGHIVTSTIEHKAVLESCRQLEREGFGVSYVMPDRDGRIVVESIRQAIQPDTRLISIMYANNELGTIQPIAAIGKLVTELNTGRELRIFFHSDAVQAATLLSMDVRELGVNLLSWSGHKLGGPLGIGCLFVGRGVELRALVPGGGQEQGRRSGTPNLAGAIGLAAAMTVAVGQKEKEYRRLGALMQDLREALQKQKRVRFNGGTKWCLPSHLNISIANKPSDELVIGADLQGLAVSAASACSSGSIGSSHVVAALPLSDARARSQTSMRISLGYKTTTAEIEQIKRIISGLID